METSIMTIIGIIIFSIGALIISLGRTLNVLRFFFGDRSMFTQMFWGIIFICIGLFLIILDSPQLRWYLLSTPVARYSSTLYVGIKKAFQIWNAKGVILWAIKKLECYNHKILLIMKIETLTNQMHLLDRHQCPKLKNNDVWFNSIFVIYNNRIQIIFLIH